VEPSLRDHPLDIQTSSTDLVQVDPRLTAAALAHLLENAAQYSPEGAAIDVRGSAGAEGLRLVVRDRGTGIDPTDLEHLFTRFYRGARASEHPFGTGMGLAITRGLLTAEGGRVWAENHPGGGAQFTIVVPASVRRDLAAAASSPTP
jgi:signal transduction histidine kinase